MVRLRANPSVEVEVTEDCGDVEWFICAKATTETIWADDLFGKCHYCKEKVRFRPYGPPQAKKVCFECAKSHGLIEDLEVGAAKAVTSPRAEAEFLEWKRKKAQH